MTADEFFKQPIETCFKDLDKINVKTPSDFDTMSAIESGEWEQIIYLFENHAQEIALMSRTLFLLYMGRKIYKNHRYYFKTFTSLPKNFDGYLYIGSHATISAKIIILMWWIPAAWFLNQEGNLDQVMVNLLQIDYKYALIFVWFPWIIGIYEFLTGAYLVETINVKPPNTISISDKWFNRAKFVGAWLVIWMVEFKIFFS